MRHERFDDFHLLRVRHLPTAATMAMAERRLGPAEVVVVHAWARLWRDAVPNIEAFAAEAGHMEPGARPAREDAARRDEANRLARSGARPEAAGELLGMALLSGRGPVRDEAFHVLEDARLTLAFVGAGVPLRLQVRYPGVEPRFLVAGPDGLRHADAEEERSCRDRADWQAEALNPDWASRAFASASGREMALCRGYPEAVATLLDMALQGHDMAFLKHVEGKRGTWIADLSGVRDFVGASASLFAAVGVASSLLFAREPERHSIVVQGFVPFTHEHRFFCVGHRVVASTASVRSLGLADGTGRLLDPRVARLERPAAEAGAYDRGASAVVEDRALVARMAVGARRLARGLRREGRFHGHYVIDMGLARDGRVAAIEVNSFTNAGLYAVDPDRIARSLARWYAEPDRRPSAGFVEVDPLERVQAVLTQVADMGRLIGKGRGFLGRAADAVLPGRRRSGRAPEGEGDEVVRLLMTFAASGAIGETGWRPLPRGGGEADGEGDGTDV